MNPLANSDTPHGPLTRNVKLRVAHAPGMPGTFSSPARISDLGMHHGTCVTHVPWCMPGLLTRGFPWSRWRGKRSRYPQRIRNLQFYVSEKRSMKTKQTKRVHDSGYLPYMRHWKRKNFVVTGVSVRLDINISHKMTSFKLFDFISFNFILLNKQTRLIIESYPSQLGIDGKSNIYKWHKTQLISTVIKVWCLCLPILYHSSLNGALTYNTWVWSAVIIAIM